jgi:hypothetical protein
LNIRSEKIAFSIEKVELWHNLTSNYFEDLKRLLQKTFANGKFGQTNPTDRKCKGVARVLSNQDEVKKDFQTKLLLKNY